MTLVMLRHPLIALVLVMASCSSPSSSESPTPTIEVAHLGRADGDAAGFEALHRVFVESNPGYDVAWHSALDLLDPCPRPRVLFVQSGEGGGAIFGPGAGPEIPSELTVGDLVLLHPGEGLRCYQPMGALVFTTPDPLPPDLPGYIRPDWDPSITDTPGGCAEEEGAYRRILLTWLPEKGPYIYHSLNAHRVRITDSFSHYHPIEGGFDELYLVQMVQPGARLLTSERIAAIEDPESVTREHAATLLDVHVLEVGDLVYLPRGTMHRGLGGVLAQIISVPGFLTDCEVGVDHHLRAIDERLGLEGPEALPYHESASDGPVIK